MKTRILFIAAALGWASLVNASTPVKTSPVPADSTADFNGAQAKPLGTIQDSVSQLTVRFPSSMNKSALKADGFSVTCSPAVQGFSGWADNDTLWTYSFQAADENQDPHLVGGTKCQITQTEDIATSTGDKTWKSGTIQYNVIVAGPNIIDVYPASGFNDSLRETEPVMLLAFDGPVDRAQFFAQQDAYLSYTSANAPSEKMPLAQVPTDQEEQIFNLFKQQRYFNLDYKDKTWILATVKQNLIPGAQTLLTVQGSVSAANADVQATVKYTKEFSVRSQFEAKIECSSPSAKAGYCLPQTPISVTFNGRVKWSDVKDSYIEYIPYKSTDRKVVRSYPQISSDQSPSLWDSFLDYLGDYIPYIAQFSSTVVDNISFDVKIEPQTTAKVVLKPGLTDIDGRRLSNAIANFNIRIGAMTEVIHVPQNISFFEKNVPNLFLPVGVVNLNQKLSIRKTGTDAKVWTAVRDVHTMIEMIRAYDLRGDFRATPDYTSPLEQLKIPSTVISQQMTGTKNRPSYLQFPFAAGKSAEDLGGLYAFEITSPTLEANNSDSSDKQFYNPKYVLAQVTDLAVHMKRGTARTTVWVTQLSEAQPVSGASVSVYDCNGDQKLTMKTGASGLASFDNQQWAKDCKSAGNQDSIYVQPGEFFVAASSGSDLALVHSSWSSSISDPSMAPGLDYFYSNVSDGRPYFHSIIGVNLVTPGQNVPVQLVAKLPNASGFGDIPAAQLPVKARIINEDSDNVYYEFPLTWNHGMTDFNWQVPSDSSVKLGRYSISLYAADGSNAGDVPAGDIEVAEFKVPLMSGIISFPNQSLVQPTSIPVSAIIRYANGVGAKSLATDMSYYFEPTSIQKTDLSNFTFGTGTLKLTDEDANPSADALPNSGRPATIQGLSTAADGSISKDIALEKASDGRTISDVLKSLDRPQKLVVRVRYQDQMGEYQTLSQSKDIYNSNQYVGTSLISGSRSDAKLQAAIIDANQNVVTSLTDLDLKLVRVDVNVIGEELFGGMIKNTIEREVKPVRWSGNCQLGAAIKPSTGIADSTVKPAQVAICAVGLLKAGNYAFQATSKSTQQSAYTLFKVDDDGRVYGKDDYYHFGDDQNNKQLPLATNKKTYKDGDRAVISFPSPFKNCRALVSIERSDVMQSFVVNDACQKGFVEVPISDTMAPNAFVSVYAITGRASAATQKVGDIDLGRPTYKLGFANLKVNWSHFRSAVAVKTDKDTYKPGDTVQVQAIVHPDEGTLKNGSVTFVAIEEKILELKPNDTYKVLEALMQMRPDAVQTITPLERVETVTTPGNGDIPSDDQRKGGDDGGDGSSKSDFKRKLFNALVVFKTGVPVQNGVAQFSFKTNDSLTRFKIFAIAVDDSNKFGTGEVEYLTSQDTQSYSNIPSVAYSGDNFPVKVTLQNNGKTAMNYKVVVTATIKDQDGKVIGQKTLTQQASVDKGASNAVAVGQITTDQSGSIDYDIKVYDQNGKLVDEQQPASQSVLASVPLAVHDSYIVQVDKGSFEQVLNKEPNAIDGKGEIRASLSKSLVDSALQQVVRRMDRDQFADFMIESRFQKALLKSSAAHPEEVKKVMETMVGCVDTNGFLKDYPEETNGSIWFTASVLNSLQLEPWALKVMPAALASQLKNAVQQVLSKSVDPNYIGGKQPMDWLRAQSVMGTAAYAFNDATLQAQAKTVYTALVTALQQNPAAYGATTDHWANYDLLNFWLYQAAVAPTQAPTSSLYQQVLSRLTYAGNSAQLNGQPMFAGYYTDETMDTALLLLGHSKLHMDNNVARALAAGLVNSSKAGWYGPDTMSGVAEALKAFGRAYETEPVSGTATMSVVELQKSVTVDWSQGGGVLNTAWPQAKATLQVTQNGSGKPWVEVQTLTAVPLTAARGQGLSIDKQIHNINRPSGYAAGDIIEVTINLHSSSSISNIAMMDPIPAGANIVNDAYGDYSSGQKSYSGYNFFFSALGNGVTTVKYQYQLNNPGSFNLPPTRAQGVYMPGIYGEAPNAAMTVQ